MRKISASPAPAAHLSGHGAGDITGLELRHQIRRNTCNQDNFAILDCRQYDDRGAQLLFELIDSISQSLSIRALNLYSQNLNATHGLCLSRDIAALASS